MLPTRREALKLYCSLIKERITHPIYKTSITEVHHIIPRCVCKILSSSKYNLIRMYAYEHWLAHYYLSIIFPRSIGVQRAFLLMSDKKSVKNFIDIQRFAKAYENSKRRVYEQRSNKSYSELYGKTAAEKIKIKKKKKQIDRMIRIIPLDK